MANYKHGYASTGMVEMPKYTMNNIFCLSPDEQSGLYSALKKKFISSISKAHEEILAWEYGEINFTVGPLDFESRIQKELNFLSSLKPNYNLTLIYNDGCFNKAKAGAFLVALHPYPDDQKTATISLDRIEFLIERKDFSICDEHLEPNSIPENEETTQHNEDIEETSFLSYIVKELKLPTAPKKRIKYGEKEFSQGQVLFALYQYCEDTEKPYTSSIQKFSERLQPLIVPDKTANSLQQLIGRSHEKDKDADIGTVRLKNLSVDKIKRETGCSEVKAKQRFKKWDGLYNIVKEKAEAFVMTYTDVS